MRTPFDFSPLRRSAVGLDSLFDTLEAGTNTDPNPGFPPFDIEQQTPDKYRITLAVPGYSADEIEIIAKQNLLTVSAARKEAGGASYVHKGIAAQPFERRFMLGDHVQVRSASLEEGLLTLALEREIPEALKARKIEIRATASS